MVAGPEGSVSTGVPPVIVKFQLGNEEYLAFERVQLLGLEMEARASSLVQLKELMLKKPLSISLGKASALYPIVLLFGKREVLEEMLPVTHGLELKA